MISDPDLLSYLFGFGAGFIAAALVLLPAALSR